MFSFLDYRCPRTEIGKEAIKRHWFVETPDTQHESDVAPEKSEE